jgi:hypothetical protein
MDREPVHVYQPRMHTPLLRAVTARWPVGLRYLAVCWHKQCRYTNIICCEHATGNFLVLLVFPPQWQLVELRVELSPLPSTRTSPTLIGPAPHKEL